MVKHRYLKGAKTKSYCWETPQDLFDKLMGEFVFDIDVCANKTNYKVTRYFDEDLTDALEERWIGTVWMNPPYGHQISKWVKKAYEESLQGATVVCLLPSRTDTRWWWDYCMKGEIRFIKGRLKFKGKNLEGKEVNYPATFPSAIVIFRPILYPQNNTQDKEAGK